MTKSMGSEGESNPVKSTDKQSSNSNKRNCVHEKKRGIGIVIADKEV